MKKYKISKTLKIAIKDLENRVSFLGANNQEDFDDKFLDKLFVSLMVRDQQKRLEKLKK